MCGTASGWAKVALLVMLAAMCLHIAGWVTQSWMVYEGEGSVILVTVGLWRQEACFQGVCSEFETDTLYVTVVFNVVRILETIVLCVAIIITVLLAVYVFIPAVRLRAVAIALVFLCVVTGLASMIGFIIFMIDVVPPFVVAWSMGLTVIAFLLIWMTGVLLLPDILRRSREETFESRTDLVQPYTPPPHPRFSYKKGR
ncbi:uncharacterized protein [Littorina saxatilis]|uniref:Uncharacterized protein n=1 Tax=Littorina saxatilis TaxID=31220 RepID=A0AAN9C483_9CAEN